MKRKFTMVFKFFALSSIFASSFITFAEEKAQDSKWVFISSNSNGDSVYSGKADSFELTTTKSGIQIALILGQVENTIDKKIEYNKWYVKTSDCKAGMGKLAILDISGDYIAEVDYVVDGKNVASSIAAVICDIYKLELAERDGKSL